MLSGKGQSGCMLSSKQKGIDEHGVCVFTGRQHVVHLTEEEKQWTLELRQQAATDTETDTAEVGVVTTTDLGTHCPPHAKKGQKSATCQRTSRW